MTDTPTKPEPGAVSIGQHPLDQKAFLLPFPREQLLFALPKGGTVAEVGVAAGDFARLIAARVQPDRLLLIDPWRFIPFPGWEKDGNRVTDDENQQRMTAIADDLAEEIADGRVTLHQGLSHEVVPTLEDACLDWAYIDADHTYESVLADLRTIWPKLKADGMLLGHDYTHAPYALQLNFGVVEAVRDFAAEQGITVMALTMEGFASFVLAKDPASERARNWQRRFDQAASLITAKLSAAGRAKGQTDA